MSAVPFSSTNDMLHFYFRATPGLVGCMGYRDMRDEVPETVEKFCGGFELCLCFAVHNATYPFVGEQPRFMV